MAKNKNKAPKDTKPEVVEAPAIATEAVDAVEASENPVEAPEAPSATTPPEKVRRAAPVVAVSNPALINWPTDIWGITKDVKKAIVAATARVNGQADKKAVLDSVLRIALAHLEARFEADSTLRAKRIEKAAADAAPEQIELF